MRVLCQSIQNRALILILNLHKPPSVPLARGVVLLKRVYYSEKHVAEVETTLCVENMPGKKDCVDFIGRKLHFYNR